VRLEQLLAAGGDDRLGHRAREEALHAAQALELHDLLAHPLLELRVELLDLVLQRLDVQQALHPAEQLAPVDRLGEEVVGARLEALDALGRLGRGDEDHGKKRGLRIRPQPAAELVAVHARHHDVGDYEVGRAGAHRLERLFAVERDLDLVAEIAQQSRHQLGVGALVVHHEDALGHL
jgi:hypothetical protein